MFAVVTVSDRASQDASFDKSGPVLKSELEAGSTLRCFSVSIVPDDRDTIQSIVKQLCSEPSVELVLTTGGTGFGQRDVTPEAIGPLLEREASGLVSLGVGARCHSQIPFLPTGAPSYRIITRSNAICCSRPTCCRNDWEYGSLFGPLKDVPDDDLQLVLTLPGSVKAVKESLSSLLKGGILQHALDLIRGGTGEGVHQQLAAQDSAIPPTAHSHSHHHHHHHGHDHSHAHDHSHGSHSAPQSRLAKDPTASSWSRSRCHSAS